MNEKPIIFSGEMVRAILDGRKTQTRRVVKPPPGDGFEWKGWLADTSGNRANIGKACWDNIESLETLMIRCPYGKPGDLLWVRETWGAIVYQDGQYLQWKEADRSKPFNTEIVFFRAEEEGNEDLNGCWRPSIFMPRGLSRITLRVTDVRVERVQDIDKKSAIAEGVQWREAFPEGYTVGHDYDIRAYDAVLSFKKLWDRINGKRGYGWDVNPWVWVVEFELASPHPAPRNENTTSTSGRGGGEGGQNE